MASSNLIQIIKTVEKQPADFDLELFEEFIGKQILHEGVEYEIYATRVERKVVRFLARAVDQGREVSLSMMDVLEGLD